MCQLFVGAVVEWLELLDCGAESCQKVMRLNPGFASQGLENSLCQLSSKWVSFFKSGQDKAVKGKRWALPFIGCAQGTVGL